MHYSEMILEQKLASRETLLIYATKQYISTTYIVTMAIYTIFNLFLSLTEVIAST